jgi:hypothetical protein
MSMSSCSRGLGYGNELPMDVFSSVGGRGDGIVNVGFCIINLPLSFSDHGLVAFEKQPLLDIECS